MSHVLPAFVHMAFEGWEWIMAYGRQLTVMAYGLLPVAWSLVKWPMISYNIERILA